MLTTGLQEQLMSVSELLPTGAIKHIDVEKGHFTFFDETTVVITGLEDTFVIGVGHVSECGGGSTTLLSEDSVMAWFKNKLDAIEIRFVESQVLTCRRCPRW